MSLGGQLSTGRPLSAHYVRVQLPGSILIANPRPWFGNQNLGAFTVYIDGKRAGTVLPASSAEFTCAAGRHTVRVRRWFYFSQREEIEVLPGKLSSLTAGMRGEALGENLKAHMLTPWNALSLTRP